jgi:hypothetical protein
VAAMIVKVLEVLILITGFCIVEWIQAGDQRIRLRGVMEKRKETKNEYYCMMGLKKRRDDSNENNSLQSDM